MFKDKFLMQIYNEWALNDEYSDCFIKQVVICRELAELLKCEGFSFIFKPGDFSNLNRINNRSDAKFDNIPIKVDDIDSLIYFEYGIRD